MCVCVCSTGADIHNLLSPLFELCYPIKCGAVCTCGHQAMQGPRPSLRFQLRVFIVWTASKQASFCASLGYQDDLINTNLRACTFYNSRGYTYINIGSNGIYCSVQAMIQIILTVGNMLHAPTKHTRFIFWELNLLLIVKNSNMDQLSPPLTEKPTPKFCSIVY